MHALAFLFKLIAIFFYLLNYNQVEFTVNIYLKENKSTEKKAL
jgi:hypothetical protein